MRFKSTEFKLIEDAIQQAESRTSGELVVSIVRASSYYPAAVAVASAVGLLTGTVICQTLLPWGMGLRTVFVIQLLFILLTNLFLFVPVIARSAIGKNRMARAVHEHAQKVFLNAGLMETRDRTGILILISLLEHRVEILADKGIHTLVGEHYWSENVAKIIEGIHSGSLSQGTVQAINEMVEKLAIHFPKKTGDTNELPDKPRTSD